MKHLILSSIVAISLLGASTAFARASVVDADSEADVAAHSYNPGNEDCKCLGTKSTGTVTDDRAHSRRVADWVSSQSAQGPAPALDTTGAIREN